MINIFLNTYNILEKHQKLGILKMQFIIILTAFTEVAGVASIGPFMSLVSNPSQIYQEGFFNNLYDISGASNQQDFLALAGIMVVTILLTSAIVATFSLRYIYHFAQKVGAEISSNLFDYYISSNWLFHTQKNSSNLITNLTSECSRVTTGIIVPALIMNAKIFISLSIILFLFWVDPLVSIIGFTLFGSAYSIIFYSVKIKLEKNGEKLTEHQNIRIRSMNEGFGGIKDILLMDRADQFKNRFRESSHIYGQAIGTQQTLSEIPKYWIELLAFGTMILLVLFLMLSLEGDLSTIIPTLSMFAMASYKLIPSFQQIYFYLSGIKFSQSAILSVGNDLKNHLQNKQLKNRSKDNKVLSYDLNLENVFFKYPNKNLQVTNGVSIFIPENSMVGFVGPSGSGKSTLIDIILGLLIPSQGLMKVGGKKIDESNANVLQALVGYVPQTIFLGDCSIKHNIAFGLNDRDIDLSRIDSAVNQAQLNDLIDQLPEGLDTIVGEKGVQLSGGQRQRIAIARALYRNPKILVLDEATSSLDGMTEKKIMDSIYKIASDITVLIIAHRLNTIKECDMIYYMDDGKIIDYGNYEALMNSNKNFRDLSKTS